MTGQPGRYYTGQKPWPAFMDNPDRACLGADLRIFFPNVPGTSKLADQAKAICARCPFEDACGEHAIETGEPAGVWGGLTADERDAIRKQRKGQAA